MKGSTYLLAAALVLVLLPFSVQARPAVVTSIRPLQLIAAEVMHGVGEPALLIPGRADPHHHALRPSERRLIADADLLLWVGPALEGFLERLVDDLRGESLSALALPDIQIRMQVGSVVDPHVWLSADNALVIARALAQRLSVLDPGSAALYHRNLSALEAALVASDARITQILGDVSAHQPYAVYHNAFGYFEGRYGLLPLLSVTQNEEIKPGLRQLLAIREQLRAAEARCMLVQSNVNVDALRNVVDMPNLRYIEVDVLGSAIEPGPGAYPRLLEEVALALRDCLRPAP